MKKRSRLLLLALGITSALNILFWLLLNYTSFGYGVPESVQTGGPIFTFVVTMWYFITNLSERKK